MATAICVADADEAKVWRHVCASSTRQIEKNNSYLSRTRKMLFDALSQAFPVLGGGPRHGIFDKMKKPRIADLRGAL